MAAFIFNAMKGKNISNDALGTVKALLLRTTGTAVQNPDLATVSAVLAATGAAEANFTNYARVSITITRTQDDANDRAIFSVSGGNIAWASAGGGTNNTPVAIVFFDDAGSDASSVPIYYGDLPSPKITDGTTYTVPFPSPIAYVG